MLIYIQMITFNQLVRKKSRRVYRQKKCKVPALKKCPQKKGVVQKIFIETPKKPNSARRKTVKVKLTT